MNKTKIKKALRSLLLVGVLIMTLDVCLASSTLKFQRYMFDGDGNPITTSIDVRFSLWQTSDYLTNDVSTGGVVNTLSASYAGFTEVQTHTPTNQGLAVLDIGSVTSLPDLDPQIHKYLQVEIKANGAPDSAYELMDIDTDLSNSTDREAVDKSAYSINTILLDGAKIGTSSGDIAVLHTGGVFHEDRIPAFTNETSYTINNDNSIGDIFLNFGDTINKFLKWSSTFLRFEFNSSLFIDGDITVTGSGTFNGKSLDDYDDQTAIEVPFTATGDITSTNVQHAIEELQGDINNINTTGDDNQTLSFTGTSITIQGGNTIDISGVDTDTDDQVSSEVPFTATGGMISTNVQDAIYEAFLSPKNQSASGVAFTATGVLTSTNVQKVIEELLTIIQNNGGGTSTGTGPAMFPPTTAWFLDDEEGILNYIDITTGNVYVEGDIHGMDDDFDIEALTFDSDGVMWLINNDYKSTLYKVMPNQLDGDMNTPVVATYVGGTGLYGDSSSKKLASLQVVNGVLFAISYYDEKIYSIDKDNGKVNKIAYLNYDGSFRCDGFTLGADGNLYFLKVKSSNSELWKFHRFPFGPISKVLTITGSSGPVESLAANENGYLYAADDSSWFRLDPSAGTSQVIFTDHNLDVEGLDFYFPAASDAYHAGGI